MTQYTVVTTPEKDAAIAWELTQPDTVSQLAANKLTLDASGFVQGLIDGGMRLSLSRYQNYLAAQRLMKLADPANANLLAQVDAAATPVAKP